MPVISFKESSSLYNFLINNSNTSIVIDFSASWCSPCKHMTPIFLNYSNKRNDLIFIKLMHGEFENDPDNPFFKYDITSLPTFILLKNNIEVKRVIGADEEELKELVFLEA